MNVAVVQGAANIAFALPINWAKRDIENVILEGRIVVPYLGVRYVPVSPALAEENDLPIDYGILVKADGEAPGVIKDSPAAKAGLKEGDIIIAVDGKRLEDGLAFARLVAERKIGDTLTLTVRRSEKEMDLRAKLEERKQ